MRAGAWMWGGSAVEDIEDIVVTILTEMISSEKTPRRVVVDCEVEVEMEMVELLLLSPVVQRVVNH